LPKQIDFHIIYNSREGGRSVRTASSIVNGIFKARHEQNSSTQTRTGYSKQDVDKIFTVKEEGKDINSITRTVTWVRARPAMEVDERDAVATVKVAILWPNREQQQPSSASGGRTGRGV
jgi:hypothetical protein